MPRNIFCVYGDRGAWCTNQGVKRSLFGFGARVCVEQEYGATCDFKQAPKRPSVTHITSPQIKENPQK